MRAAPLPPAAAKAALACAAALAAACAPEVGAPLPAATASSASSFQALLETSIVPRCATAACHAGAQPAYAPPLDADLAWGELVGKPSGQAPELLVEPGAPERSYLVMKLRGTGAGALMPIGDAPFDESEIAAIEAWIANGAPND